MKLIIGLSVLLLCSIASANEPDSQGQGMYCSTTAEYIAKYVAKANDGATKSELAAAVTTSADAAQGDKYTVKIGRRSYLVTTEAMDGDCSVKEVRPTDTLAKIDLSCKAKVITKAQEGLDALASANGFSGSNIDAGSLKQIATAAGQVGNTYVLTGEIYKGQYAITITADEATCDIFSVNIVSTGH